MLGLSKLRNDLRARAFRSFLEGVLARFDPVGTSDVYIDALFAGPHYKYIEVSSARNCDMLGWAHLLGYI